MKKFKKTVYLILFALLLCGAMFLTGCDPDKNTAQNSTNDTKQTTVEAPKGTTETSNSTDGSEETPTNPIDPCAKGHAEAIDQAIAPTCTEKGKTEGKHCSVCNEVLVAQNDVDALGHTEVTDTAVAPTCTEKGKTEGKHCSVCNEVLVAQGTISALGHAWDEGQITIPPTISSEGIKTFTCLRNSIHTYTEEIEKLQSTNTLAYTVNEDGITCTITGIGACTNSEITIPKKIDGFIVTKIAMYAFYNCESLVSIAIPDSVTEIGTSAFYSCSNLKNITIPNSVTEIGTSAFDSCSNLKNITIPNSVTSIEYYAFSSCISLTNITIPQNCTSISNAAFYGCEKLESIVVDQNNPVYHSKNNCLIETATKTLILGCKNSVIPTDGSVTSIGNSSFYRCLGLIEIVIPDSITNIGWNAFGGKCNLESVYYAGTAEEWEKITIGYMNHIEYAARYYYSETKPTDVTYEYWHYIDGAPAIWIDSIGSIGLEYEVNKDGKTCTITGIGTCTDRDLIIPRRINGYIVTGIGKYAFYHCQRITSITLPNSVTSIGDSAFSRCTLLENISLPDGITSIDEYAFGECISIISVIIPNSITNIGEGAFYGCTSLESVILSDNLRSTGDYVFAECVSLTDIAIPNSVTNIGKGVFADCTELAKVTFSDNLETIGSSAFAECVNLTTIVLPNSVTSIGSYAFENCTSLTSITISNITTTTVVTNSETGLYYSAFKGCTNLKNVTLPNNVKIIGDSAFYGCTNLTNITLSDNTTCIEDSAFNGCTNLTTFNIPNSVTNIGSYAFSGCTGLTGIIIPNSVTSMGSGAFSGCTSLKSVIISHEIISIEDYTFKNCTKLAIIAIPYGIVNIGKSAFENCTSLINIVVPKTLKSVGTWAFSNCPKIQNIYYSGTTKTWSKMDIDSWGNETFTSATRYYYSETEPTDSGKYWHYVDDVPTPYAPFGTVVIPEFGADDFSKQKPAAFKNATIVIDAANCETNSTVIKKNSNQYHLYNLDSTPGASAHGVCKLNQDGIFHYYIDLKNVNSTIQEQEGADKRIASISDCYIRWTFTVTEAGTYTVGSYMRLKNNADRSCQIQFDNQKPLIMHYTLDDDISALQDSTEGSYLTWDGVEIELGTGEHILTYTIPSDATTTTSWHWRTIFLIKKS